MLQILRNKAQSIVIQAIVVIIALVFIFWGVGTNMMNSREAAIVINDEEISFQDFQTAYERAFNRIRDQFGGNVPQGLLENLGIKEQVTNQLIQEALLRQGAAEMGITVSREEIRSTVQNMVQFEENEGFSMEKYSTILAANGFTPTTFEESIKVDLLAQKASLGISGFATTASEFEIEDLYRMEKSTVTVKYATINRDDFKDLVEVTDDELTQWYATNQDNYKTEPKIKLKYLDFSHATVGEKINLDEKVIEQYYQDNSAEYTTKEQRRARHILFKADDNSSEEIHADKLSKAQEVLEMARQGGDFIDLAKQYSEGPSKEQGGDLGLFSKGQMVPPFEDAVFALETGGISEIVKTTFGYHIIKLEEISPAVTQPFDQVKESIRKKLQTEQAKPMALGVANAAYEGIISAGSLTAYLEANPATEVMQTGFFSRSNPPKNIGTDQNFLNAAFALNEKELSSLIETSTGYAILFAEEVKSPEIPELVSIKDRVTADFKEAKATENAQEKANTVLQQAKSESSLAKAAENNGLAISESGSLSKADTSNNGLPPNLVESAFKLSTDLPYPEEPVTSGNSLYVFELKERKSPEAPLSEADRDRYKNAIIQLKQQQVLSGWLKNRRELAKVYTHKNL